MYKYTSCFPIFVRILVLVSEVKVSTMLKSGYCCPMVIHSSSVFFPTFCMDPEDRYIATPIRQDGDIQKQARHSNVLGAAS